MENSEPVNALMRINAACGDLSSQERLEIMSLAWLVTANDVRTAALIAPGGFPEERARQVAELRKLADLIEADEPDLEMERILQEGDREGFVRLSRELRKSLEEGNRPKG